MLPILFPIKTASPSRDVQRTHNLIRLCRRLTYPEGWGAGTRRCGGGHTFSGRLGGPYVPPQPSEAPLKIEELISPLSEVSSEAFRESGTERRLHGHAFFSRDVAPGEHELSDTDAAPQQRVARTGPATLHGDRAGP